MKGLGPLILFGVGVKKNNKKNTTKVIVLKNCSFLQKHYKRNAL